QVRESFSTPERHGFWGRKAFANLGGSEVRLDKICVLVARGGAADIDVHLVQPPVARFQHRALRLDAFEGMAGGVESEHADAVEAHPLFLARCRVDDRLAVHAPLAHPEAGDAFLKTGLALAENL